MGTGLRDPHIATSDGVLGRAGEARWGKDRDGGRRHSPVPAEAPADARAVGMSGCSPHSAAWRAGGAETRSQPSSALRDPARNFLTQLPKTGLQLQDQVCPLSARQMK